MSAEPPCVVATDGRRGIENQALGLAEAVGRLTPLAIETVTLPRPGPFAAIGVAAASRGAPLGEPFLWIGCGRAAVHAAPGVRRANPDGALVYVQDPKRSHDVFDLIVAPTHDGLERANAIAILGSPNRITDAALAAARAEFSDLGALARPRAAVLIGGASKRHRLTRAGGAALIEKLRAAAQNGRGLMISTSRRTPDQLVAALRDQLGGLENVRLWTSDADGPNPYFGFLAHADLAVVTKDSTNMITEAASAGLPVLLADMGGADGKLARLYAALEARGAARPFIGELEPWPVVPLRETERAAQAVAALLKKRGLA